MFEKVFERLRVRKAVGVRRGRERAPRRVTGGHRVRAELLEAQHLLLERACAEQRTRGATGRNVAAGKLVFLPAVVDESVFGGSCVATLEGAGVCLGQTLGKIADEGPRRLGGIVQQTLGQRNRDRRHEYQQQVLAREASRAARPPGTPAVVLT